MCVCTPEIRTMHCSSYMCQQALLLSQSPETAEHLENQLMTVELKEAVTVAKRDLLDHQASCTHPEDFRISVSKSNTGNYDPYEDSYWIEHECKVCDLRWVEDK